MAYAREDVGEYILGLDIGVASVGWALIGQKDGKPDRLIRLGSRVFDAGMDEGSFEAGKENSRNATRRQARQARRMTERRVRRQAKLYRLLARAGLLPEGDHPELLRGPPREERARYVHEQLKSFDADLKKKHLHGKPGRHQLEQVWPYWLRARALTEKLEPYELGRALYHLGQRRGFLSNRKELAVLEEVQAQPPHEKRKGKKKEDGQAKDPRKEELGVVKADIALLEKAMKAADAETLGQYFASLDPHQKRIRQRWTSRDMYKHEFGKIWEAQAGHHSAILTDDLKKKVYRAMFHQRPLKNQAFLIGWCEFEKGRRRAPWALLISQRFRMLQQVNDLRIVTSGNPTGDHLTVEQRDVLLARLEGEGDLKFKAAKELLLPLGLPKGARFNWESGGEDRFLGNRTNAKMFTVFGDRWWQFPETDRERIVEDVLSIQKAEALARRGKKAWGLHDAAAKKFGSLVLEDGYCNLSRQALAKLVPMLQDGLPYATAVKEAYGKKDCKPVACLPPAARQYPHIRNPMVLRVLSELRKVVNAIVRKYGKPAIIRVELARNMRRSKKQRTEAWQQSRQNETLRKKAIKKIFDELQRENPSRGDVEKVLLADECDWTCPYTGNGFNMNGLLGPTPQVDVEHIIPFGRCLEDSFVNKTLCDVDENRHKKRNRTPFEAYGGTAQYKDILARVRGFKGRAADEKMRRFLMEKIDSMDEFASRQLNDTRYASRQATDYVAVLYGGQYEKGGKRFIQASRGGVTAYLRNEWQLNTILGDGGTKSRDDHRHHAVDAVVTALTEPETIKMLSDAAERAQKEGRRRFGRLEDPWPGFLQDVRAAVEAAMVSHRVSHKVNGPLHEETNYAPSQERDEHGKPKSFTVRKPIDQLTPNEVEDIFDEDVKKIVKATLDALGGDPKKAFKDSSTHPFIETKYGRRIPIHAVRIRKSVAAFEVGRGMRGRYVTTESNHHVEVFEVGKGKWDGRVVSRYEALRRQAKGAPVIDRKAQGQGEWRFSLTCGDLVEMKGPDGKPNLYAVRTVCESSQGRIIIAYAKATDARKKKKIIAAKDWRQVGLNALAQMLCRKVVLMPLGEVRYAHD